MYELPRTQISKSLKQAVYIKPAEKSLYHQGLCKRLALELALLVEITVKLQMLGGLVLACPDKSGFRKCIMHPSLTLPALIAIYFK